jgi:hypothetical protein
MDNTAQCGASLFSRFMKHNLSFFPQLVNKLLNFPWNQRFIAAFTTARQ